LVTSKFTYFGLLFNIRFKLSHGHPLNVFRYRDGKDHMGEHRDDEKELDQKSGIASVSLGQVRDFVLRHSDARGKKKRSIPPVKIPLGHGSLLLMKPPTNTFWYHSIPQRKSLPGVRINLTFRLIVQKKQTSKN
jgi:alkylated DNA repair dioxygenase AlkB